MDFTKPMKFQGLPGHILSALKSAEDETLSQESDRSRKKKLGSIFLFAALLGGIPIYILVLIIALKSGAGIKTAVWIGVILYTLIVVFGFYRRGVILRGITSRAVSYPLVRYRISFIRNLVQTFDISCLANVSCNFMPYWLDTGNVKEGSPPENFLNEMRKLQPGKGEFRKYETTEQEWCEINIDCEKTTVCAAVTTVCWRANYRHFFTREESSSTEGELWIDVTGEKVRLQEETASELELPPVANGPYALHVPPSSRWIDELALAPRSERCSSSVGTAVMELLHRHIH